MKKINIILIVLAMFGLLAIQSCKKDEPTPIEKYAFTDPVATSPVLDADGYTLFTGGKVTLSWNSENKGGAPKSWEVYFGTGKSPALYAEGVTVNTIDVDVLDGQTYYWKVKIKDEQGVETTSPVWSFLAVDGSNPFMQTDLTCQTDVLTSIGVDLEPDKVVEFKVIAFR
ncbi:MAG: hypothetical protein HC831_07740 [Chloroflexia bacterium]|nr:hypothetical protein [Chloroflexia bacterium]